MAARRERERRRPPTERRYNFAPATAADEDGDADDALLEGSNGVAVAVDQVTPGRPASQPFSAYATEYAYVTRDLRRVAVVFGSLLVALILLYIILGR
jgi:hypothetical protein